MIITANLTGTEAVRAQFAKLNAAMQTKALALTAKDIYDYAEREADKHTKTRALFQSTFQKKIPEGFAIGHDLQVAPHALFVHDGTKPHPIFPKGASLETQKRLSGKFGVEKGKRQVLRWSAGGKFVFARFVNHPGYKGDPWLKRAAAMAPKLFEQHVTNLLRKG